MMSFKKVADFRGPIVLYMSDLGGYGDVSFAVKITRFLGKKYPGAMIYIIGQPNSYKKIYEIIPDFFDKKTYSNLQFIKNNQQAYNVENVQLEIETAICKRALSQLNFSSLKIFIGDYGTYEKSPYNDSVINMSGNVGINYPGILIEEDLLQFSRLNAKDKRKAQIKILENLSDLPLKTQILMANKDDTSHFIAQNNFAFSYYNYPISYRRAAIFFAASNKKKHANYFVSLASGNNKDNEAISLLHDEYFISSLEKLGYQKIIFYDQKSARSFDFISLNTIKNSGKEFRIFLRSRFSHKLTLDLMRLSEICGVAGDQSLTEAISLGLVPIPEEWQCQFNIVDQIAKTYYNKTVMEQIYHKTWRKQRKTDVNSWIEAGKIIQNKQKDVAKTLSRIQEEANLYKVLEHRLNTVFSSSRYSEGL